MTMATIILVIMVALIGIEFIGLVIYYNRHEIDNYFYYRRMRNETPEEMTISEYEELRKNNWRR
jgi:hypothetical protein